MISSVIKMVLDERRKKTSKSLKNPKAVKVHPLSTLIHTGIGTTNLRSTEMSIREPSLISVFSPPQKQKNNIIKAL